MRRKEVTALLWQRQMVTQQVRDTGLFVLNMSLILLLHNYLLGGKKAVNVFVLKVRRRGTGRKHPLHVKKVRTSR